MAAMMLGIVSCQNDELVTEDAAAEDSGRHIVTATGAINSGSEERAVSLTSSFHWNEGDCFTLYDIGDDEVPAYTFYISDSYSNDSLSSTATFTGECDLPNGEEVVAVYPVQDTTATSDTLRFSLPQTVAMGSNSDEEIEEYISNNMYMYAYSSSVKNDKVSLEFYPLTVQAHIVYTNETDEAQTINNVSLSGNGEFFGTESYMTLSKRRTGVTSTTSEVGLTFDGLTVAAGETADFYILFFANSSDMDENSTVTVTVNDMSVTMTTMHLSEPYFYAGFYYTLNVSQSDDGLSWTNYVTLYKTDNSTLVSVLYGALGGIYYVYLDSDGNLLIPQTVIKKVDELVISYSSLTSLAGLEIFENLATLDVKGNSLTSIDVTCFPNLHWLDCRYNYFADLDLSCNPDLEVLYCSNNPNLKALDLSGKSILSYFNTRECDALTSVDCSDCPSLGQADANTCPSLKTLDASDCTSLTYLNCLACDALTSVNVSNCTALNYFECWDCKSLPSLDVSGCTALTTLNCYQNTSMTSLNLSGCTSLTEVNCAYGGITTLNTTGCTALTSLGCYENAIESLDLSTNTSLTNLICYVNCLESLDLSENYALSFLSCYSCHITYLDITKNSQLAYIVCGSQRRIDHDNDDPVWITVVMTETQKVLWDSDWCNDKESDYVNVRVE